VLASISQGWAKFPYPLNEISRLGADKRRDRHFAPHDSPICHHFGVLEGGLAHKEFVRQDAQAPEVDFLVIPVVGAAGLDHLRGQVVEGTAHGLATAVWRVHAPAKVGNLDLAVDPDQDVLGLDVPVDDVLPVQVLERRRHLRDVLGRLPLGEAVFAAQVLVQLSLAGKLENEEHPLAVVEMPVQLQDVGVAKVALDLNLAADLLFDSVVLQLVLVEYFERAYEAAGALLGKVHAAKLPFPQGPSDLKHAEVELLRHRQLLHQSRRLALRFGYLVRGASGRRFVGQRFPSRRRRGLALPLTLLGSGEVRALRLKGDLDEVWPACAMRKLGYCRRRCDL